MGQQACSVLIGEVSVVFRNTSRWGKAEVASGVGCKQKINVSTHS